MDSPTPSSIDIDGGPGEIGELLRASRIRQGQDLTDVAGALRIRIVYLQAIEASRYEDLPGAAYALGFIRSYADHLGLDGDQLVTRFKSEASTSGQGRKPILSFPTLVPENGIPRGAVVTIGGLILLAAYGGWYFLSSKDLYVTDLIPPVPESITRAIEAGRAGVASITDAARVEPSAAVAVAHPMPLPPSVPVPLAASAPSISAPFVAMTPPAAVAAPAAPLPAAVEDTDPASAGDDEVESTPPPTAAPVVPAAPIFGHPAAQSDTQSAIPGAVGPDAPLTTLDDRGGVDAPAIGSQFASLPGVAADPDHEIVLKATVDSWIQIRDTAENKLILTRLLRKGEQYAVPPREGLTLVTGNAGGLEVTVGGEATPSLGPIGVVRRNVILDPQRLRAGTAIIE